MTLRTSCPLALFALLAACVGDEPTETDAPDVVDTDEPVEGASFAEASDDELVAAAVASVGFLPAVAWSATVPALIDAITSDNECPTLSIAEDGVQTYTASGCTAPSGAVYDGTFVAENLPDLFGGEEPDGEPMSIRFESWKADGMRIDGTLWQSEAMPSAEYTTKSDLTLSMGQLPAASWTVEFACSIDASLATACTSATPAAVEVDGLGLFEATGPWGTDEHGIPTGRITLKGADTLVLDVDGIDTETGCIPTTLDGAPIADICIGQILPTPDEPEVTVMGAGVALVNEEVEVTMWTLGPVDSVDAELIVGASASEMHPVPYVGLNPLEEDTWSLFLTEGAYVAGESTALEPFSATDAVAIKLRAFDVDGQIVGCAFAGTVMGMPGDYFGWSDCPGVW